MVYHLLNHENMSLGDWREMLDDMYTLPDTLEIIATEGGYGAANVATRAANVLGMKGYLTLRDILRVDDFNKLETITGLGSKGSKCVRVLWNFYRPKIDKLFVSIPIHGRSDEEVLHDMKQYVTKCEDIIQKPLLLVDTLSHVPPVYLKPDRLWYLGQSISLMDKADYICFAEGWNKAKGCQVEREVVRLYGRPKVIMV